MSTRPRRLPEIVAGVAAARGLRVTNFSVRRAQPNVLTGNMTALPQSAVTVSWARGEFASAAPLVHPSARNGAIEVFFGAQTATGTGTAPFGWSPARVLHAYIPSNQGGDGLTFGYGNPFAAEAPLLVGSLTQHFYREVAAHLDSDTRSLVLAVLDDTGHAGFAVEKVRAAIDEDPRVGGRLALWARRLMGEALSQSQRVVADRDALSTMLVGGVADGFDLAEVGRMFSRITEAHTKRMAALGLAA